ncbi:MAG: extracellular solute-binding protein [Eubacteriales bacterium]|nr:extracellular solute-binding protein [Eubacteriales bacterium]
MKESWKPLLAAMLAAVLAAGCGAGEEGQKKESGKVTLTLNMASMSVNRSEFVKIMREQFPEIEFVVNQYGGVNGSNYMRETLVHEDASDLIFYGQKVEPELSEANYLDLSGYDFISRFDSAVLNQFDLDGRVYQIPGTVTVRSAAYNKTMFEKYGWEKPENFDELVALCRQIRKEAPDIIPIAMSMGGVGYPFTAVTTMAQAGFLSTPDGVLWEEKYLKGEASSDEGWGEALDMMGELIEAEAFEPEEMLGVWDAQVIERYFENGKSAMMFVWGGQAELSAMMESSEDEYELFPFFGARDGEELLGINISTIWGINRRLGEAGNEKKLEQALKVLDWIATSETQELLAASPADIPSLKQVSTDKVSSFYKELWEVAQNGHKAQMIYSGYEDVLVEAGTIIQDHILSGNADGMRKEVTETVDRIHREWLQEGTSRSVYGQIEGDLDEAQTVQLFANMADEQGLGDFVLMTHGEKQGFVENYMGVAGKMYGGVVDNTNYLNCIPAKGSRNLFTLTLTGEQVKQLLTEGKTLSSEDGSESYTWPYYWAGIDVEQKGDTIASVRLDGAELEETRAYQVVFIDQDYTEETAQAGNPTDTGAAIQELWLSWLKEKGTVQVPEVLRRQ